MKNIVIFGGNGYIGQELVKYWNNKEKNLNFYIVSRGKNNKLENKNIKYLQGDASNYSSLIKILPDEIYYIINLVGGLEKDNNLFIEKNIKPVENMINIAKNKNIKAMGFIGGILGPKKFVTTKKNMIEKLKNSNIPVAYVEPTIVYGNGRNDKLAKLIPIFKFLSLFNKKFKPVLVEDVLKELIENIEKY